MGQRILLVEDDELICPLLKLSLRSEGYSVDAARTMADAWSFLDRHRYSLVVSDWKLPDGDGRLILDAAAQLESKTVLISGYLAELPGGRVAEHMAMMKPFRVGEMVDAVHDLIGSAEH